VKTGNPLNPNGREITREPLEGAEVSSDLREYEVTVAELERLVKRSRGRAIYLRACWFAQSKDQKGAAPDTTRGFHITGNVEVPKRVALKFLACAYYEHIRDKVWARITFNGHCLFIGG
jgi:hypothetical protein